MPSHIRKIASWDDPYQRDRSLAQIGQFIGMMTERKQAKRQEKEERASQALRALSGVASSWSSEDWERNRTRLLQNMLEAGYTEDVAQVVIDSSISAAKRAEGAVSQKDAAQQAMQKAAQSLYTQVGVPQGLFNLGPWGMAAQRKPDTPAQAAQFLREQGRGEEAFMGQMGLKDLGMLTASEMWVPPPKEKEPPTPPKPERLPRAVERGGKLYTVWVDPETKEPVKEFLIGEVKKGGTGEPTLKREGYLKGRTAELIADYKLRKSEWESYVPQKDRQKQTGPELMTMSTARKRAEREWSEAEKYVKAARIRGKEVEITPELLSQIGQLIDEEEERIRKQKGRVPASLGL